MQSNVTIQSASPLLAASFLLVVFPLAMIAGPPAPDCLVFNANPGAATTELKGTVLNQCGKAITAYSVAVDVLYANGASTTVSGAAQDFAAGLHAPAGSGLGAILPGEARPTPAWNVPVPIDQGHAVAMLSPRVASVVFSDATALGDDDHIDRIFAGRRDDLREYRFWRDTLEKFKPQISSGGSMKQLIDLANIPERRRSLDRPGRPHSVATHADMISAKLGYLDSAIQQGTRSRAEAVSEIEEYLTTLTENLETNSVRKR